MKITTNRTPLVEIECDAIVIGLHSDGILGPRAAEVNQLLNGLILALVERGEITGKKAEVVRLYAAPAMKTHLIAVVGLGPREHTAQGSVDQATVVRVAGAAAKQLADRQRQRVVFGFDGDWDDQTVAAGICGAVAGCQGQDLHRAEKKLFPFAELIWHGATPAAVAEGTVLGESVNLTRRLINEPPSAMTPVRFAAEAEELAGQYGLQIEVWDESRLEQERCGALLAVARGSAHPPRLVRLQHQGGDAQLPAVALVGKGVTFDSGGYSLKPSEAMLTMKCDMSGAATVLGTMVAVARLNLPINVVGYMGLVENMVSGDAYKLGDVLTARNGTTIEVQNTDAEGRLVLADVLDVAVEQGAGRLIDLATLTGACMVALGLDTTGLMTNDQAWCDEVTAAARQAGEPVWQLPMFVEFDEQITSEVADIKNVGEGRWGGAITAAKLLERFVADRPWVHADIAGPAFAEKPKPWRDAGGTGAMVRALVELLRRQA